MKDSLEKPSYEEYWPGMEGLAQREIVTNEADSQDNAHLISKY
jgi:hypothetical protein